MYGMSNPIKVDFSKKYPYPERYPNDEIVWCSMSVYTEGPEYIDSYWEKASSLTFIKNNKHSRLILPQIHSTKAKKQKR